MRSGRDKKEQVYDPSDKDSPRPLRGDIVIFNTLAEHVAVATGDRVGSKAEVMSLWTQNSRHVYTTTIEDLMSPGARIRFFSPKW